MKIKPVDLFATPKDMNEILEHIERMPKKSRNGALIAIMFTWNLACKLSEQEEEENNEQ